MYRYNKLNTLSLLMCWVSPKANSETNTQVQAVPLKVFPQTPVGYWKSEGNKHKERIKINKTKG